MMDCAKKELGQITTTINGLWTGKKPPFINIAVIRNTNFSKDCRLKMDDVAMIDVEVKQFASRKLQMGDIIIEKSGGSDKQPVGRPVLFNIPEGDYSFSNFTSTLRVNDQGVILPEYLHKFLYKFYLTGKTAEMQSKTTGLRNLDFNAYKAIKVPVPSIEEQQRIVDELNLLTSIIDKKNAQLRDLDALAQSIFYEMFGDPIINERGWPYKRLDEVAKIVGGATPKTQIADYWTGNNFWVTPAELRGNKYQGSTERTISDEAVRKTNVNLLPVGTVLLSSRAPIGKVAITTVPMYCNQGFKNLVCSEQLCNEYAYQALKCKTEYLNSLGTGATFKEISKKTTEAIRLAIPPIELQKSFADKAIKIEEQKGMVSQSLKEAEKLFNSRMDYYFND